MKEGERGKREERERGRERRERESNINKMISCAVDEK